MRTPALSHKGCFHRVSREGLPNLPKCSYERHDYTNEGNDTPAYLADTLNDDRENAIGTFTKIFPIEALVRQASDNNQMLPIT